MADPADISRPIGYGEGVRTFVRRVMVMERTAILTGFVQNVTQLLIVRFLLGVPEGGVWPATLVLLAHWFPRAEWARANNLWMIRPVSATGYA